MPKLSRRGLLLSACAGVLASQAQAWPVHGVAVSGPTVNVTLRGSDTRLIDLTAALATATSTERIMLSVSGNIAAQVWPYVYNQNLNGSTTFWAKATLLRNLAAVTSGLSQGATGSWTLSWAAGSHTVAFTVDNAAPTEWDYGQKTLAQYGGYPIAQYLPGNASDWTIQSQSTAGAFAVNAATGCVAFAGTAGSTTRTVGTPTLGNGAYTVTLNNAVLGQTATISFNMLPYRYDAAYDDNTQTMNTLAVTGGMNFGDTVVINDTPAGSYQNPSRSNALTYCYMKTPTQRAGGPAAPAGPYVSDGWDYADGIARNAGWITIRPRTPWGARLNQICAVPPNNDGKTYVRWYLLDNRNNASPSTGATITAGDNTNFAAWQMWDSCIHSNLSAQPGNETVTGRNMFVLDNYVGLPGPSYNSGASNMGVVLFAEDSQIVGNFIEGIGNDAIAHACFNTVFGSGKSKIWWNMVRNKQWNDAGNHGDYCQFYSTPQTYAKLQGYANAQQLMEVASELGNVFVRGQGSTGTVSPDVGKDLPDGQGSWAGDFLTYSGEYQAVGRLAGMIVVGSLEGGVGRKWYGPGSTFRHNTIIWPGYVTNPSGSFGQTDPGIRFFGASGKMTVTDTVLAANVNQGSSLGIYLEANDTVTPPAPVVSNNFTAGGHDATALFTNPTSGLNSASLTLEAVIDALTPKPGSAITVAGGAARVAGAVGAGLIDHLNRTYTAGVMDPDASAPTAKAAWNTSAAISGTPSVGSVLTGPNFGWSGYSTTLINRTWNRINGDGSFTQVGTASTYTVQAGDSGLKLFYTERVTDSLGNVCTAVAGPVRVS